MDEGDHSFSVSAMCPFCTQQETIDHALLVCPWTKPVWFGCLGLRWEPGDEPQWIDILEEVGKAAKNGDDYEKMKLITLEIAGWELWKERSRAVYNRDRPNPTQVVTQVLKFAAETWLLQFPRHAVMEAVSGRDAARWQVPNQGVIKLNCDGSWEERSRRGGTAVVARDESGCVVAGRNSSCRDFSAMNVEARAILQAVELAVNHRWEEVIVESDSEYVINQIRGHGVEKDWRLENIIGSIRRVASQVPRLSWKFVRRNANRCAQTGLLFNPERGCVQQIGS